MGNANSNLFTVCRTLKKKKNPNENGDDDSTVTDSAMVQRNRDKYFSKDDYDKIMEKYPLFKEWIDESTNPQTKDRPKVKKIKFREAEVIGLGSYGRVIMGLNIENGCLMATKQVQLGNGNNPPAQQEKIKALQMEIELLSRFSHKKIVRYYGGQKNKTTFNIFLEYVSGGTIASLLDKYGPFNENLIRLYVRQILEGLEYLHVRNTIHRDIKGANILVDNNGVCKLADFGTATKISGLLDMDTNKIASIKGTVRWMAPEIIKQNSLGRYCDIWSVGCTVIEMATAKPPWHNVIKANSNSISTLYQIAQAKSPPPFPKGLSPEAIDFLKQCFKINPQERPNIIKLLQHKFVTGIESVYQSFEAVGKDPQKTTTKAIPTKQIAQADMNPNQNFRAAYTEVTSKVLSRQQSAASPSIKSTHEVHTKEKMVELEHKSSFSEKQKEPEPENEEQQENRTSKKKTSIDEKISGAPTAQQKLQKGKTPKTLNGKKYLVQTDGPEAKSEESPEIKKEGKAMGESDNAKARAKRGAITLDLRTNQKVTIAPRPLGQSPNTNSPYTTKQFFSGKSNKLSEINCFLEGESDSSSREQLERVKLENEDDGVPAIGMKTSAHKNHGDKAGSKRPQSGEVIPEAKADTEEVKEKNEDKKDMKKSVEKKRQQTQMRINIPEKDEKEEDNSDSRDSDRDPSVANSSVVKPSGNVNVLENGSFSTQNIEGRNMRINVHDQSSRLSFRRDNSFEGKLENGEGNLQSQEHYKTRKSRTQSEVLKPEMMGLSGSIKKDGKTNKSPGNWSLMIPEGDGVVEGKRMVKKKQDKEKDKEKEKVGKKEKGNDNEYLQNFNLLDDLNKVYGQLEATSPPINL